MKIRVAIPAADPPDDGTDEMSPTRSRASLLRRMSSAKMMPIATTQDPIRSRTRKHARTIPLLKLRSPT